MSQQLEIEFKNILTVEEFTTVKEFFNFKDDNFVKQINYYFDTDDFSLKRNNSALRIRQKENEYELTVKSPAPVGLYETNVIITKEQSKQMIETGYIPSNHIKKIIENILKHNNKIKFFGELTTFRAETIYKDGLIVLDKSTYLNNVDYELEYEVSDIDKGEIIFMQLLNSLLIPKRKTDNKIKRFYKQKQKLSSINGRDM